MSEEAESSGVFYLGTLSSGSVLARSAGTSLPLVFSARCSLELKILELIFLVSLLNL